MKTIAVCIVFLVSTTFLSSTWASNVIPRVYVLVEDDKTHNRVCNFSYRSAEAAARSALRFNRIDIVENAFQEATTVYIGAGSFMEIDGRNSCAVAIQVEFWRYQTVNIPVSNASIHSRSVFCRIGTGGILPKSDVQDNLNAVIKRYINECLAEIEKKVRK